VNVLSTQRTKLSFLSVCTVKRAFEPVPVPPALSVPVRTLLTVVT